MIVINSRKLDETKMFTPNDMKIRLNLILENKRGRKPQDRNKK